MTRRATAQDVADLAGVSRSAVSLVLNGRAKGNISAAKQQAVLEAARRLDYSPNAVAQNLRTARSRSLGVLTWRGVGGLPLHLIAGALQTSLDAGYTLVKVYAEPTELDQHRALSTLSTRQVDGMLVVAPELCQYQAIEALAVAPVVLLNCTDPGGRLTSVTADEEGAGAEAVRVLVDRGHRNIGVVSGPLTHVQTALRVRGVRRALAAAGSDQARLLTGEVRIDVGCAAATSLLTSSDPPTALVCTNERLAVGALLAAARLGLSVPHDVSVVSLDDREQLADQLSPAVVRVERPDDLMAAHAASLLIERVQSNRVPDPQQYTFVCPVSAGGSVAAPVTRR